MIGASRPILLQIADVGQPQFAALVAFSVAGLVTLPIGKLEVAAILL